MPPDEPPGYVVDHAKRLHATPVADLAQLVFDSLVDADSPPEDHQLRFEHPDLGVSIRVSAHPDGTEISGRVTPAAQKVVLYTRSSDVALVAEAEGGRFGFPLAPHGLVRLSIESDEPTRSIWTDWFRV